MDKTYKKKSRYPRDKKGRLKHLQVVKKRGDYRIPGFHEVHHKDGNPPVSYTHLTLPTN